MFSEYYFYLISFMSYDRKDFPTVFRIDRIADFKGLGEKFHIPYSVKRGSYETCLMACTDNYFISSLVNLDDYIICVQDIKI